MLQLKFKLSIHGVDQVHTPQKKVNHLSFTIQKLSIPATAEYSSQLQDHRQLKSKNLHNYKVELAMNTQLPCSEAFSELELREIS